MECDDVLKAVAVDVGGEDPVGDELGDEGAGRGAEGPVAVPVEDDDVAAVAAASDAREVEDAVVVEVGERVVKVPAVRALQRHGAIGETAQAVVEVDAGRTIIETGVDDIPIAVVVDVPASDRCE